MAKNIVIFSDGTGQAGGLRPDQTLSNIYKLFRACRTDTGSPVNPQEQIASYDPGLGTENDEGKIPFRPVREFRKLWSRIAGTGLSRNITDCYEAILKHYEPGDRIFLFGFSRGAYTARCVGGVLALCGIPSRAADGEALPRFGSPLRKIADEAVRQVYEHGSGSNRIERKKERLEKARRFRQKYASNNEAGEANVVPYFIGVFDTVAALGAPGHRRALMMAALIGFVTGMAALAAGILSLIPQVFFAPVFAGIVALVAVGCVISGFSSRFKWISDYPVKGSWRWHFTAWKFRFYDLSLNPRVRYARHALAIDERRADFMQVPWANADEFPNQQGEPERLQQVWFAGNHSDVGGSYAEDESRLSDISLKWMVEQAVNLPHPLIIDHNRLNLFPDICGMQHCEIQSIRDAYPSWWPASCRWTWGKTTRTIAPEAPLHPTVLQRFRLPNGVLDYGRRVLYRPVNLGLHARSRTFYPEAGAKADQDKSSSG